MNVGLAKGFLLTPGQHMSTRLDEIGTVRKSHLETKLSDYAEGLVRWFAIATVPQSLAVGRMINLRGMHTYTFLAHQCAFPQHRVVPLEGTSSKRL